LRFDQEPTKPEGPKDEVTLIPQEVGSNVHLDLVDSKNDNVEANNKDGACEDVHTKNDDGACSDIDAVDDDGVHEGLDDEDEEEGEQEDAMEDHEVDGGPKNMDDPLENLATSEATILNVRACKHTDRASLVFTREVDIEWSPSPSPPSLDEVGHDAGFVEENPLSPHPTLSLEKC